MTWADIRLRIDGVEVPIESVQFNARMFRAPRPHSGRRRGGMFPQWRWSRVCKSHGREWIWAHYRGRSAYVDLYDDWRVFGPHPRPWIGSVAIRLDLSVAGRFARRCDAKRWCELVLAEAER